MRLRLCYNMSIIRLLLSLYILYIPKITTCIYAEMKTCMRIHLGVCSKHGLLTRTTSMLLQLEWLFIIP